MSQSANVTSIESIKEFRASLCRFGEDVQNALGTVEMEIRRALDWVLHEQPAYWQLQIKRRKEELSLAQAELFRRKLQAGAGREVHDTEQKEAVRTSQRRLLEAEEKLEKVRKWGPVFQHAVSEYQARARPTGDMLGSDLRVALELLDRMTTALDAYIAMAPPVFASGAEAVASSAAVGSGAAEPPRAAAKSDASGAEGPGTATNAPAAPATAHEELPQDGARREPAADA